MAPLRREWAAVQAAGARRWPPSASCCAEPRHRRSARSSWQARRRTAALMRGFRDELAAVQVLDPACGSGNFLYVALRQLLDLENEVDQPGGAAGRQPLAAPASSPEQLHGIEINPYAHELAQATVWIGYIQWLRENGYGRPARADPQAAGQHPADGRDPGVRRGGAAGRAGVAGGGRDHREPAVPGRQEGCGQSWATSTWRTCSGCTRAACRARPIS